MSIVWTGTVCPKYFQVIDLISQEREYKLIWFYVCGQASMEAVNWFINIRCVWSNMAGHAQMPKVLQNDKSTVSQGCVGVWSWFFVYELTSVEERKMFLRRYQLGVVWHGRIKCCVMYRRDWWILSCLIIILIYCDAKHLVSFTGVHSSSSLFSY